MSSHKPNSKRLTERVHTPFANARVNREAGTIDGVLICGTTSANGRDYPAQVLRRDCAKYEGRPVNCDHGRESTVDRRLGWFTNVRAGDDGRPRGTLHLLKSHPMYERVMEAAERNPALYGFSHVAMCRTRPGTGGRETVEAIERVESIDLVAEPATTNSLFEGVAVKISLKQFVERFGAKWGPHKWGAATKLVEDLGDMGAAPVMDEPPADVADGDLKGALTSALMPMVEEAFETGDATKAMAALKDFIKLHAKHTGKAEPKDPPAETTPAPESKQAKLTDVIAECAALGVANPTGKQLATLAEIPTAAGRALVIESIKGAGAQPERPTSAGRGSIAPAAGTGTTTVTESKPPVTGAAFATFVS